MSLRSYYLRDLALSTTLKSLSAIYSEAKVQSSSGSSSFRWCLHIQRFALIRFRASRKDTQGSPRGCEWTKIERVKYIYFFFYRKSAEPLLPHISVYRYRDDSRASLRSPFRYLPLDRRIYVADSFSEQISMEASRPWAALSRLYRRPVEGDDSPSRGLFFLVVKRRGARIRYWNVSFQPDAIDVSSFLAEDKDFKL